MFRRTVEGRGPEPPRYQNKMKRWKKIEEAKANALD